MNSETNLPPVVADVEAAGDWDDVLRRAARLSRSARRLRAVAAVATVALSAVVVSPALGVGSWYSALFGSAARTRPPLVVQRAPSGRCELGQGARPVTTIPCLGPQIASTSADPISDASVYTHSRAGGQRAVRFAGSVAPGVAAVALITTAGKIVATTPVTDGFYMRMDGLPQEPVEAVVGIDSSGRPVACDPASAPHCPVHLRSVNTGGRG